MPGQRCIFDGILLPNGHVVLIGGQMVRSKLVGNKLAVQHLFETDKGKSELHCTCMKTRQFSHSLGLAAANAKVLRAVLASNLSAQWLVLGRAAAAAGWPG
jgi:hypothetical protein